MFFEALRHGGDLGFSCVRVSRLVRDALTSVIPPADSLHSKIHHYLLEPRRKGAGMDRRMDGWMAEWSGS